VNKSLCDSYTYEDGVVTIKLKAFEAIEKYSSCIYKVIDMLFQEFAQTSGKKVPEPEVNEQNQFQMLHLFALFGLNDKKKKLTQFIQANISSTNLFNYLLCIADYIKAGLQEAYLEEIKYWYWLIVFILLKKHTKGKLQSINNHRKTHIHREIW